MVRECEHEVEHTDPHRHVATPWEFEQLIALSGGSARVTGSKLALPDHVIRRGADFVRIIMSGGVVHAPSETPNTASHFPRLTQDVRETPRVGRTPLPEMRVDLPWSGPSMPISYTDELCG